MARPKSQTVDYFPHTCNHGKTMFVIEQKYGNDGYAFWFKLLELLGSTSGHTIRAGNPDEWEFLQAKTRLHSGKCTEILDLLATLNAIDQALWNSEKVIWSQNFVDGIKDAYSKRKSSCPTNPGFRPGNVSSGEFPPRKQSGEGVSGDGNGESKVKESKEKEREETGHSSPGFEPDRINSDTPLPPILQADWDRLLEIYPGPHIGKDEAIKLFCKSAERPRILRAAGVFAESEMAKAGKAFALDRFVRSEFRAFDKPAKPLGQPPGPDVKWREDLERDREQADKSRGVEVPVPEFMRDG